MKQHVSWILLALVLFATTESKATDQSNPATAVGNSASYTASLTPSDTGFGNDVRTITVYNGDLIVGGNFNTADGFTAIKVAGWDGAQWYPMNGFPNGNPIYWLHEHNGLLYAGQALTQLNSWDGNSWTGHEPWLGNTFGNIWTLETYGGELYVGGGFKDNAAQPSYIAIWNGAGWDTVGTGLGSSVVVLDVFGTDLIAGGFFSTGDGSAGDRIAKWNGTSWSPLGSGIGSGGVRALTTYNSELIVGGNFVTAGGIAASNIARWNGVAWDSLGAGLDGWVEALIVHNNTLIAGGRFFTSRGTPMPFIAQWNGSSWSAIGSGLDDDVYALGEYNGYLIAGGAFSEAGGHIALLDGATWRPVSDIVTDIKEDDGPHMPRSFSLDQNYPNPFNPSTQISFVIPKASLVKVDVYNMLGQHIRSLVNQRLSPGRKEVTWNGTDDKGMPVGSGVYLYRFNANGHTETRRMLLLK